MLPLVVVVVDAGPAVAFAAALLGILLAALVRVVSLFCLFLASLCALATTLEMARRLVPLAWRRRLDPAPPGPPMPWGPIPPPWTPPGPRPSMAISPSSPFCRALASFWKYFCAWVRICTTVRDLM